MTMDNHHTPRNATRGNPHTSHSLQTPQFAGKTEFSHHEEHGETRRTSNIDNAGVKHFIQAPFVLFMFFAVKNFAFIRG